MNTLTTSESLRLPLDDVITRLGTNASTGLSPPEVSTRRAYHGDNVLKTGDPEPLWKKFIEQFKEPMILLLLASAGISVLLGSYDDAISITLAIVIVVTVAFVQEYRSDKSLEALNDLAPPHTHCLRAGAVVDVLAADVVLGDIVILNTGDRVPADLRLLEAVDLEIDESSLTGETEPRRKNQTFVCDSDAIPLAERNNMAHMGTLVCCGRGTGIVTGTGLNTELGKVFVIMSEQEETRSPLQHRMDALGKRLSMLSFGVIGVIVLIGLFQHKPLLDMFTIGVSLAVAAIPEGLPIVVTVTLALGVMRMAKRNAVVKKLPAVESLGCTTVVCVDKTGTLTRNEMTAVKLFSFGEPGLITITGAGYDGSSGTVTLNGAFVGPQSHPAAAHVLEIGAICNNATVANGKAIGQPTEAALVAAAQKIGLTDPRDRHTRVHEIPFNSDNKWMAVRCVAKSTAGPAEEKYYVKGSVESVASMCVSYLTNTGIRTLSDVERKTIAEVSSNLASDGLRVLALASGSAQSTPGLGPLTFAGFIGLHDAPRDGVADAVAELKSSGVIVVMITGDSVDTALAIASKLNLLDASSSVSSFDRTPYRDVEGGADGVAMSGNVVDQLSEDELANQIGGVRVFYRAVPRHKLKIVKAFQALGHVVAMTGDGVNDAPALKAADIGISMGLGGTDVAKEASDMVLLNDDFATILAAIEEGKSIFYNIRNFVRFQLSTSIAALMLLACSTVLGLPSPLNAMQILWINIIMDGPPAQSLGVEPVDPDVMRRPPRGTSNPIITQQVLVRVLVSASIIVTGTLYMFWHEMTEHTTVTSRDTTLTFTTFVMYDMFNALSCRSAEKTLYQIGLFSNKFFLIAVGGSIIGQLLVVYFPPLQAVFQTEAIDFADWLFILAITCPVFLIDEFRKLLSRRGPPSAQAEASSSFTRMLEVTDESDSHKARLRSPTAASPPAAAHITQRGSKAN